MVELKSAHQKVERAKSHLRDLEALLIASPPFTYVVEIDIASHQRCSFARRNTAITDAAALVAGDVVHNLRSALDHAYWELLSPNVPDEKLRRKIQFPLVANRERLETTLMPFSALISESLLAAIHRLMPYREGGDQQLALIHDLDVLDKHKVLVPSGDYSRLSSTFMQQWFPEFPDGIVSGFGSNARDVIWTVPRGVQPVLDMARRIPGRWPPAFEQIVDVPVDAVFVMPNAEGPLPVVPTLHELVRVTARSIAELRAASET